MQFKRLSVALVLLFLPLYAISVDTVITADGSPGPYPLGRLFVNESSLNVSFADSTNETIPPYTYVDDVNGVMFSEPVDSGRSLRVRYTTSFYGLPKTYSLYRKYAIDTTDSATRPRLEQSPQLARMFSEERLDVSGYKSVGVSVGSQGQMNLEQALEVRIFGDIAPETELSANLSDQGTSLEGDTREIGELDMVYIALTNPRYHAIVGDQYVSLAPGGILYEKKKIKGLSAGFTPPQFSAKAYGAIAGGKYAIETMRGQQGFQGPYYLSGNGEPDLITPIGGTVKVWVDGAELEEGDENDFTVDYDLGAIRFTPLFAISDDHIIKIEYEYKTFDYQRIFSGADIGFERKDTAVSARGIIWYETDNKNVPIELDITDALRDSLRAAGDNPPPFSTAREVHPNDVAAHSQLYPLYRKAFDALSGDSIFVYTPYNTANPFDNKGYFYVWFREVSDGTGDYVLDSIDYRGPRFIFASKGAGTHTPNAPIAAPQRTITGEINTRLTPRPWLALSVDVAGEEKDKNLYSSKDDNDNTASATKSSVRFGRKVYDDRCLWTGGNHTFISKRFSREVISFYERKVRWNRENDLSRGGAQHAWESFAGATVLAGMTTEFFYGQYIRNDSLLTHRMANSSRLAPGDHWLIKYDGDFFRHMDDIDLHYQHHDRLSLTLDFEKLRYGLLFDDERKSNGADTVRGYLGGGADMTVKPVNLFESIYYSQQKFGDKWLVSAPDTGSYFAWTQRMRHSLLKGWTLSANSSYQHRIKRQDTVSTTLIAATNEVVSPRTGVTSRQQYSVSSERASAFIQIPVHAGTGQGMYSLDSSTNELSPDPFGNYYVYEQEVLDRGSEKRVRKTELLLDWSFKPPVKQPKGFLADVTWRGQLGIKEHLVSDRQLRAGSWIPAYYTLNVGNRDRIQYAHAFYRQDADWRPRWASARLHIGAHIRPSYKLVRRLEEQELEWGPIIERSWDKWHLAAVGRMLIINRDGVVGAPGGRDTIKDQYVELLERWEFIPGFFAFVKETAGRAAKDRTLRPWGQYYLGQPGLRFQPRDKGFAEAAYTISYVDIDGIIDYRMAQGYSPGLSHTISVFADINIGKNFTLGGNYRGEFNRPKVSDTFKKPMHVVSVEVKAYL